jgi:alginate O-acetyltransferase complex protein AlgJ
MKQRINVALIVVFAAVLCAPMAAKLCHLEPKVRLDEKRVLAEPPKESLWSWGGIRRTSAIAAGWERYFNDHFGLRKVMVQSYRLLSYHVLRRSPEPSVVLGESDRNGRWLYLDPSVNKDGIGFESSLGLVPYNSGELQTMSARLVEMTALVRKRGARFAIIICPDKQTIYPEYLPPHLRPQPGTRSRLDQFWDMAKGLTGVPVIDPRPILKQTKRDMQLYLRTDTHWNLRAGFLSYQAIAAVLAEQDPTHPLSSLEHMNWSPGPSRVGDLSMLMGVPSIGSEADLWPELVHMPEKRGKVLVVGDSFSECIRPFLEIQFAEVKFVLASLAIHEALTPALLDAEKPEIVIVESVERYWTMQ